MKINSRLTKNGLTLTLVLLVASMSLTACTKSNNTANTDGNVEQGVTSHEDEKLNDLDAVVEGGKTTDSVEQDTEIPEYDGNRYENQFLGLRVRYPENWFTDDSYDVLMNEMKELGVNDKLDLRTTKLKGVLNIVSFDSNDAYMNMIDISAVPDLKMIATIDDTTIGVDVNSVANTPNTTPNTNREVTDKKEVNSGKEDETQPIEISKFTPEDLTLIKEGALNITGNKDNIISCEEPFIVEVTNDTLGTIEVAMVEFISTLYSDEISMVTGVINLGSNYLVVTSASINEPNDVDKIFNIEDIIATLEIGFELEDNKNPVVAPVKKQDIEEKPKEEVESLNTSTNTKLGTPSADTKDND